MTLKADIAIIGGGPGGYVAALRAAQLGAKVILIEKDELGGVCLNQGCIPTKVLLRSAEVFSLARQAGSFGVLVDEPRLDWKLVQARKDELVAKLVSNVRMLLERAGVEVLKGKGHFLSPNLVEVQLGSGPTAPAEKGAGLSNPGDTEQVEAKRFIIATGSRPMHLPPRLMGSHILTSEEALSLPQLPKSILIIGGGAIGVEFATLFSALDVQVTVVERMARLLPTLDADIGGALEWSLKEKGIRIYTGGRVVEVKEAAPEEVAVIIAAADGEHIAKVEKVLLAVGRQPNVEGLGLEVAGVRCVEKGVAVDEHMRTSQSHIYAVGDVTGGIMLAHVASREGIVAAENAMGRGSKMDYKAVPNCIFSTPEVATVGLSEEEARGRGYDVKVGCFPFNGNGKALIAGDAEGFVKVVAEAKYGEILGLHIVGPHASDLILEGALALTSEATLEEIEATLHAHPTLGEAVAEAIMAAQGRAIHLPESYHY